MSGHCKAPSHLQLLVVASSTNDADPGETTAQYLAHLACPNTGNYNGWGVELLPVRKGAPVEKHAMKLLPAAAEWLPDELDRWAAEADAESEAVALQHTFAGIFRTWRSFTPAGAHALAELVRAATAQAPQPAAEAAPAPETQGPPPSGR